MQPSTQQALRLCIVGVGALGSQIVRQLCATASLSQRVTFITLIDPDVLEARNIPASRLFSAALRHNPDLYGQSKVDIVAVEARRAAPHICWTPMATSLEQIGWQDLQEHDVLVTATDNVPSRLYAAHACRLLCLPMLDAGIHGSGTSTGRIAFFPADPAAACYACTLTSATRSAALCALQYDAQGCATLPETALMDDSFDTSLALMRTAEATVATLKDFASGRLCTAFARQVQEDASVSLALTRSPDCPWHAGDLSLRAIRADASLAEQLNDDEVFVLPSPLYRGGTCKACGRDLERIAHASRWSGLPCEGCGTSTHCEPANVMTSVAKENEAARYSPDELLLPHRHLLPVRRRIQRHWIVNTP